MPAGAQVAMPRWVATGIYMQHDIIKQKIAKKHLNLLLLHCGTASQTISGLKTVFLNLRA
jgi:hypothetical protein